MTTPSGPPVLRGRGYLTAGALVTLLVLLASLAWALIMPPFSGPDEANHYNSVARILKGEGWPRPYDANMLESTVAALLEAGRTYGGQSLEVLPSPDERSLLFEGLFGGALGKDQMVQHPPGYYAAVATGTAVLGGSGLQWDQALVTMRVLSAIMLAGAVPWIIGTVRWVTASRRAGVVGGISVMLIPYFTNNAGFVTNDSLLVTACSASIYFGIRAWLAPGRKLPALIGAGVALGVALLTKGLALLLIPVIALLAILAVARLAAPLWQRALLVLTPLAVAFAVGGWWWLRNILILGRIQPSLLGERTHSEDPVPGYDFGVFFSSFWVRFNRLFWSRGARPEMALPAELADAAGIALLVLLVVVLIVSRYRWRLLILLIYPLLVIGTTMSNARGIYWDTGWIDRGVQGRYVFSGVAAFSALFGIIGEIFAPPREWLRRGLTAAFAVIATAVTWWSVCLLFTRLWGDRADPLESAGASLGVSPSWLIALALGSAAALVALVVVILRAKFAGAPAASSTATDAKMLTATN